MQLTGRCAGNLDCGTLIPRMRNVDHFGVSEYVLAPEAFSEQSLHELTQYIIGETRRIGSLVPKS